MILKLDGLCAICRCLVFYKSDAKTKKKSIILYQEIFLLFLVYTMFVCRIRISELKQKQRSLMHNFDVLWSFSFLSSCLSLGLLNLEFPLFSHRIDKDSLIDNGIFGYINAWILLHKSHSLGFSWIFITFRSTPEGIYFCLCR